MVKPNDSGEVIYVHFPRQSSEGDSTVHDQASPGGDIDAEEIEKYNFYRDQLLLEAQQLAARDGAPIDINPLDLTIRFQEIRQMPQSMERHIELGDLLAQIKDMLGALRMTTPIVVYAITLSRHSGPDLYHLVRYEGLLQDITIDTSYKNWDEVMNSDVDIVEEQTQMPDDLYFSLIPATQDRGGAWRANKGAIANDIPFSQVLAIRHTKTFIPRPRTV